MKQYREYEIRVLGKKKPRSQHSRRVASDILLVVFRINSVMNHQVPNMTGRHVSNPLAGLRTTCLLMKIEEGKSLKNESRRRHIERNKERKRK